MEQIFLWTRIKDSFLVSEEKQRYEAVSQAFCCVELKAKLFIVSILDHFQHKTS